MVAAPTHEDEETLKAVQDGLSLSVCALKSQESHDTWLDNQLEMSITECDLPATSAKDQSPSSPVMDLETDFPPGEKLDHSRFSFFQILFVEIPLQNPVFQEFTFSINRGYPHWHMLTGSLFVCVFQNHWIRSHLFHSEE